MKAGPVITLTTDFGLSDPYVASVKGVILSLNPKAVPVDVSHDISAQRIEQAAFVLSCSFSYFPVGTVHLAVVDPGVGTARRALALITAEAAFVGPDNGVLSAALPDDVRAAASGGPRSVALPPDIQAFSLETSRFHRRPVSDTFHARDIFAPVAAHLSLGVDPWELGPQVAEIIAVPPFRADRLPDGSLAGRVLHIDRFGNIITNVRAVQLSADDLMVELRGQRIAGLRRTYSAGEGLIVLVGGAGFLEIAQSGGSAALALGARLGDEVDVRLA